MAEVGVFLLSINWQKHAVSWRLLTVLGLQCYWISPYILMAKFGLSSYFSSVLLRYDATYLFIHSSV